MKLARASTVLPLAALLLLSAATIHCSAADSNADPNAAGSSPGSGEGGPGDNGGDGGPGSGDGSVVGAPNGAVCPHPHFCWENPLPQGFDLRSINGSAPDDLWAVGEAGALLHGNGSTFSNVVVPDAPSLRAVAVRSKTDALAVGDATLLSWNGAVWSKVVAPPSPSGHPFVFTHVVGAGGAGEYWVAGHAPGSFGDRPRGAILHIASGTATIAQLPSGSAPETFSALSASSPTDVWALGSDGAVYRSSGTTWRSGVTTSGLIALVAVGASDAWGVAYGNFGDQIMHWDGAVWSIAQGGHDFGTPTVMSARGPDDVWVVGQELAHYQGKAKGWGTVASPQPGVRARSVFAAPSGPTWVVGEAGLIAHDDGSGMKLDTKGVVWASETTAPLLPGASFGTSASDVWVVGERGIHFDGTSWKESLELANGAWTGGFSRAPNDAWVVSGSNRKVRHFDGNAWSDVGSSLPFPGVMMPYGQGIWASSASDVWVADPGRSPGDDGSFNHWDGSQWSQLTQGACAFDRPHAVWGSGPDDVWFAGTTTLVHVTGNGTTCTTVDGPSFSARSIWGRAANDVWATDGGSAYHYDGTNWTQLPFPPATQVPGKLLRVGASGPNDLWAVGDNAAFHFDGKAWKAFEGIPAMTGVFAGSGKDVWLTGPGGHVLRYVP